MIANGIQNREEFGNAKNTSDFVTHLPCWSNTRRTETRRGTFADTAHPSSGSMVRPNFGKEIVESLGTFLMAVVVETDGDALDGSDTPCDE